LKTVTNVFCLLLVIISLTCSIILASYTSVNAKERDGKNNHEQQNSIQICCAWGKQLEDGKLTYKITGGNSDIRQAVRTAVGQWDLKIAGLTLQEVKADSSSADIYINFKKDGSSLPGAKTKRGLMTAGLTTFTLNWGGLIEETYVTIAKGVSGRGFSSDQIELVAKHEMGHALGLGHSNFRGSIMSATISNRQTGVISDCEINAVLSANGWKLADNYSKPHSAAGSKIGC
jgi:predicted Zn-dependent protease